MDKLEIIEVLKIIISTSPAAFRHAADTIRAVNKNSPIIQQRLNITVSEAFNDSEAAFTDEERHLIGALMNVEGDDEQTVLSLRLTRRERAEVEQLANAEGFATATAYVRDKIGLL